MNRGGRATRRAYGQAATAAQGGVQAVLQQVRRARAWLPVPIQPYKEYIDHRGDGPLSLGYTMPSIIATEDATLLDSLGPIVDRENENLLPLGDFEIIRLRDLYLKQVDTVRAGRDPLGTIRNPNDNQLMVIPAYEKDVPASDVPEAELTHS